MDYGKFRFEQSKKEKESKKNQKQAELKEIQMSLNIDTNDFNTKANQAIKFLKNGDKVRIKVRYRRARELSHANLGEELMQRVLEAVSEYGACEKPAKLRARTNMACELPRLRQAVRKQRRTPIKRRKLNKEDSTHGKEDQDQNPQRC